ncbi:MAG: K(+)-transporting ATPase subunit C [Oscillospiraceae bacterium]
MKSVKQILPRAVTFLLLSILVCGVLYTAVVTVLAGVLFPHQAQGSIIEIGGKKYGSVLLGQQYTDDAHLWGRIMNLDVTTFQDADGTPLLYGAPSNWSPASEEYETLVAERVERLRAANPDMGEAPIPVDLVTCSGSGLDPHISPAAAAYQVARLAQARNVTESEIQGVIQKCTTGKFLGVLGEETVNVLKVNLMLDGVL